MLPKKKICLGFNKYNRQVNPIAGLRPNWSDLPQLAKANGVGYDELVGLIISSAMKRGGLNTKPK